MTFEIVWHRNAVKVLKKLPRDVSGRIVEKVIEAKEDPFRYAERLVERPEYKLRVGDYRVFIGVSRNPDTLIVAAVRHRKDAYKDR